MDPGVSVRLAAGLDFSNDIDSWSMTTVAAKVAKTRTLNPEDANWFLVQVYDFLKTNDVLIIPLTNLFKKCTKLTSNILEKMVIQFSNKMS